MSNDGTQAGAGANAAAEVQEEVTQEQTNENANESENANANAADSENLSESTEGSESQESANSEETNEEADKTAEENDEADADSESDEDAKKYFGKPENGYNYEGLLPEGWELNKEITEKFNEFAGKINMSQEGANEAMSFAVELAKQTQEGVLSAISKEVEDRRAKYVALVAKDPELGGVNGEESIRLANVAYSKLIKDPEAIDLYDKSCLSYHPEVVKMFCDYAKLMQDDSIHSALTSNAGKKASSETLYGATTPSVKGGSVKSEE